MFEYETLMLFIEAAKVIIAVVALWFTWKQVNNIMKQREDNLKVARINAIKELYGDCNNSDVARIISEIDWGEIDSSIKTRELEQKLNKPFALLNYVCYLYSIKVLNDMDMQIFDYQFSCIADNSRIQEYLAFLNDASEASKAQSQFSYLEDYFKNKIYPRNSAEDAM